MSHDTALGSLQRKGSVSWLKVEESSSIIKSGSPEGLMSVHSEQTVWLENVLPSRFLMSTGWEERCYGLKVDVPSKMIR